MSEIKPFPFKSSRRRAFSVVLAIELWERFGYYGMQAILTIFMVQHLRMSDTEVNLMQGALGLLICSLPVLGGVVGDQVLGTRPTLVSGAVGLTVGYGLLSLSIHLPIFFFPSLTLIALSGGLFKPNAGVLVKQIYAGDGTALDAAFTLYYMSVNVGSTASMLLVPWLQVSYGSSVAFGLCAVGLVIGLLYYGICGHWIEHFFISREKIHPALKVENPSHNYNIFSIFCGVFVGFLVLWAAATWLLMRPSLIRYYVIGVSVTLIVLWVSLYKRAAVAEKPGLLLSYILSLQTMVYLIFYQQQQSSLTFFALRAVSGEYSIGSYKLFTMSAGQFQALNPIWIMMMSPILAWLYQRGARFGRDVSFPVKILLGYICVGVACFVLWWAAQTSQGLVSPWIMVATYGAMSLGELLTMGLGLAIIARYAPVRAGAVLMGSLYLLWGIGMYGGGLVANLAALPVGEQSITGAIFYVPLFEKLSIGATIMCCILGGFLPVTKHLERLHKERIEI